MLSDVKILGYAEHVEEQALDEETYTFIEGVQNPFSCTAYPRILTSLSMSSELMLSPAQG